MQKKNESSKAMANIWDIDIDPIDANRFLKIASSNLSITKSKVNNTKINDNEYQLLSDIDLIKRRRNAYGNIWNFKTFNN